MLGDELVSTLQSCGIVSSHLAEVLSCNNPLIPDKIQATSINKCMPYFVELSRLFNQCITKASYIVDNIC
jgi:hypothetical protein